MELENRAMKQELFRTKSKISSLKREMSSIQQLHLAQQQVHVQLSAPTMISARQEMFQNCISQDPSASSTTSLNTKDRADAQTRHSHRHQQMTIDMKNLSTSSNDESLSPPSHTVTNTSCSTQTPPLTQLNSKKTIPSEPLTRLSNTLPPSSSSHPDSAASPSDEQLRLYLTETLQREKDSDV